MINILQKRRLISAIRLHFVLRSSGFYIDRWKYKCLWSHHMFMVCNINLKCHYQLERNWWQEQHNHKQTRYLENARLSCSSSEWILTQTASTSLELEYLFFISFFSKGIKRYWHHCYSSFIGTNCIFGGCCGLLYVASKKQPPDQQKQRHNRTCEYLI